ncbi:MAG TPA: hypothetical protein VGF80_07830 [Galbitalea sp.]
MTTLDFVATNSFVSRERDDHSRLGRFGIALVQLHDQLWRVTRRSGEVLGYIESFDESGSQRFRAKRMFSSRRQSLPLGEFWSIDDAIDCFRFS